MNSSKNIQKFLVFYGEQLPEGGARCRSDNYSRLSPLRELETWLRLLKS